MERPYSVRTIANWILDYCEDRSIAVTNMKLNKLVYFAYEYALVKEGRKLTNARIEAWQHGPVFRELYRDFSSYSDESIRSRATFFDKLTGSFQESSAVMDEVDSTLVEQAIAGLVSFTASQLRHISHAEGTAWYRVWEGGTDKVGMQITDELIVSAGSQE